MTANSRVGRARAVTVLGGMVLILVTASAASDVLPGPRVPPTEPDQAAATMTVRPGFHVEPVAAEPLLASPVAMSVDENGRAYVVEMRDYSERRPEQLGRIRLLSDTNHDGRYDSASILLAQLPWPTAVMCWDGGVFVGVTPDILYVKDTDGDGVADVREVVFTGFASDYAPYATNRLNVQAMLNSFHWGLDCRIHGATSVSGGKVRRVDSEFTRQWRARAGVSASAESAPLDLRGRDFSFDPRTLELRAETGGGQHGMSFDNVGRKFVCSNSDHLQQVVYDDVAAPHSAAHDLPPSRRSIAADGPAAEVYRKSPDEPWRVLRTRWRVSGVTPGMVEGGGRASGYFTGATGVTIYRGDDYGPEFLGDAFVADCGSNLIHRKKLRLSPDGLVLIGERAPDEQRAEFLASTDNWFRPVQFYNAPDGCLWVIDMYREVIEHPWSLPEPIKSQLDLDSGRDRGRIWRLAPDSSPVSRSRLSLTNQSLPGLIATLGHPNGWHRDTAARLLLARGGTPVIDALRTASKDWTHAFPEGPGAAPGRIQLLELLASFTALDEPTLRMAAQDSDPFVRAASYRWIAARLREGRSSNPALESLLLELAAREAEPVALTELALALSAVTSKERTGVISQLLHATSPWVRSAALHSGAEVAPALWAAEMSTRGTGKPSVDDATLEDLARVVGRMGRGEAIQRVWKDCGELQPDARAFDVAESLLEGIRRSGKPVAGLLRVDSTDPLLGKALAQVRGGSNDGISPSAIRLLSLLPESTALPVLIGRLTVPSAGSIQDALLSVLGRMGGDLWARSIASQLGAIPKEFRPRVVSLLISRPEGASELLQRLESRELGLEFVDAATLDALRNHANERIRAQARAVLGEAPPSRQAVVEAFIPALRMDGAVERGRKQFQDRCAVCHAFRGQGTVLGPDLASVASNGKEKLLVSILDPNREVAPNYLAWSAETSDGQSISGILVRQDAESVTLRQAGGVDVTHKAAALHGLKPEGRSLMPEGLEAGWSPADMADLLAFLTSN